MRGLILTPNHDEAWNLSKPCHMAKTWLRPAIISPNPTQFPGHPGRETDCRIHSCLHLYKSQQRKRSVQCGFDGLKVIVAAVVVVAFVFGPLLVVLVLVFVLVLLVVVVAAAAPVALAALVALVALVVCFVVSFSCH